MKQTLIIYPVSALVFLTFSIGVLFVLRKFKAVKQEDVSPDFFKLNTGQNPPDYLLQVSNNYDNLLAMPILFYAIVILLLVTNLVNALQLTLAWVYVLSRIIHSYIHVTSNRVMPRMRAFLVSTVTLLAMWIILLIDIFKQ